MMIKNKLETNTVINKIVPDFMDTLYLSKLKICAELMSTIGVLEY